MDYIVNNAITAFSVPMDEQGLLVQSVSYSGRTDVIEYRDASKHGAFVARQDRNPVMSIGINAYLLSTTTWTWTCAIGTSFNEAVTFNNYTAITAVSAFFNFEWNSGIVILDSGSVSADGQSNPRVDLAIKVYPFIPST